MKVGLWDHFSCWLLLLVCQYPTLDLIHASFYGNLDKKIKQAYLKPQEVNMKEYSGKAKTINEQIEEVVFCQKCKRGPYFYNLQ